MLSLKGVLCFCFIQSIICSKIGHRNDLINNTVHEVALTEVSPTMDEPDAPCPKDKSLHSVNDIKVMINYFYEDLSIDGMLSETYESQAVEVRDKNMQNLKQFIAWFQHQPEHLKHVLEGLGELRVRSIEPVVTKITNVLQKLPHLEQLFDEKMNKYQNLQKRHQRFKTLCDINCGEFEEHIVYKREVQTDYYCSSIEELHDTIIENINEHVIKLKSNILNQLSNDSKYYDDNIEIIKNNLKDKALQEFGRTMYDILHLQDEYYHLKKSLNVTALETMILSLQESYIQLDNKLLQMHIAVEKYGQYCNKCTNTDLIRNTRKTNDHVYKTYEISENIINDLIVAKFKEVTIEIKNDWDKIFYDLNELVKEMKNEDINLANLKPIQEDVVKMTNEEKLKLENLEKVVSQSTINNLRDLITKSHDLLKNIDNTILMVQSVK